MTLISLEAVDALLRENTDIQGCVIARIHAIKERIAAIEDLIIRLETRSIPRARKKLHEQMLISKELDINFTFRYGPALIAPPASIRPSHHCFGSLTKFRWFPRSVKILKSQVQRFGLDSIRSVDDPLRWQVVADAVNYDSKSAVKVDGIQCYLYYKHMIASSSKSFTPDEDNLIERCSPNCGPLGWQKSVADILQQCGRVRTHFQVAQRYRVLRRGAYEANIGVEETYQVMVSQGLDVAALSLSPDTLVGIAHGINKGAPLPWITEDGICRSILWDRWRLLTYEETLRRHVCAALLSFDSFSSPEARYVVRQVMQYDPIELTDFSQSYKTCYTQISVEEAAHQLSASVEDMSARIVKKAQWYHGSIFAADFFRISNDLFGHKNAARACFLVAREYERKSLNPTRLIEQFGVKRIMNPMKKVRNEEQLPS